MPAINVAYLDNVIAAVKAGEEGIIISMSNTTTNPWAEYGQSGVGIAMQVTLELIAFACLVCAVYKLYYFISKTGVQASISQLCLSFEILAALSKSHMKTISKRSSSYFIFSATASVSKRHYRRRLERICRANVCRVSVADYVYDNAVGYFLLARHLPTNKQSSFDSVYEKPWYVVFSLRELTLL